jgi:DNA-directed RNA polymerase-3 subunit RPC5
MGSNVGIERNMLDDSQDIGKPAKNIHKKQSKDTGMMTYSVNLSTDSFLSLKTTLDRLFEESAVLSLQKVRENLLKPHMNDQLQNFGRMGSDQEIHSCIMSFQKYIHLRNSYVRQLRGDSILDPLRSIVVDILQENEVIKRSDVMDKANELGVAVTDNMYSRVMKELCVSKGALWFMKSGD